jgi:hypothetical protein
MIKTYRLFNPDNTFQSKIAQSQRKDYTATAFYSSSKRFNHKQLIIPLTFYVSLSKVICPNWRNADRQDSVVIDIGNEQLLPLNEVPKFLPPRGNGKRVHISAIYRWAQRGIRGTRLEVIRVGGTTYTSREALQRFASPPGVQTQPAPIESRARQKQIDQAIKSLDEFLYKGKRPDHHSSANP